LFYAINTGSRNIDISVARTNLGGFFRDRIISSQTATFPETKTYAMDEPFLDDQDGRRRAGADERSVVDDFDLRHEGGQ
jgi:hypothetical protein